MVKYVISFLVSFNKFGLKDVEEVQKVIEKGEAAKNKDERTCQYFKPNADLKDICSINYSLPGPKLPIETKLSLACWSKLVKVYSRKDDVALRTASFGGKTWAAVTVKYNFEDYDVDQLKSLYTRTMEFQFDDNQKSLFQRVAKENTIYCCPKSNEKERIFEPIYEIKEKTSQVFAFTKTKNKLNLPVKSRKSLSPTESYKFSKTAVVSKIRIIEPELCRRVANVHLTKVRQAMQNSLPHEITHTKATSPGFTLLLPISNLFYDKLIWVIRNEKPLSSTIEDVFVFFTVYSFLNENARKTLNPITVDIKSLQYLPTQELQQRGIKKVFVEYELDPVIPVSRTKDQDLNGRTFLYFNEFKIFLTDEFSCKSIISCFQSKKLLVRVIGVTSVTSKTKETRTSAVYGSDLNDDRFSSCIKVRLKTDNLIKSFMPKSHGSQNGRLSISRSKSTRKIPHKPKSSKGSSHKLHLGESYSKTIGILIGVAMIDVSSIVLGNSSVIGYELISSQHTITRTHPESEKGCPTHFNITEAHINRYKTENGLIKNRSLFENNTAIKLIVKSGYLLTPQLVKTDMLLEAFSRTIIIFKDKEFATYVLEKVLLVNSFALGMNDYNLPLVPLRKMFRVESPPELKSFLKKDQLGYANETNEVSLGAATSQNHLNVNLESWFSGFCIDCVNEVIMFVEGPRIGVFPTLLTALIKINIKQGRVMYSSDLMYDTRVYGTFKELGGVFCITMNNSVNELIRRGAHLCHGAAIPETALKVLKTISKLFSCNNILEAVLNDYLPLPDQLISFDIEFGLPHCIEK